MPFHPYKLYFVDILAKEWLNSIPPQPIFFTDCGWRAVKHISLLKVLWLLQVTVGLTVRLCIWSTGWQSAIHQPHQGDSYQGRKKCCHGSLLPTDSRSRDHTLAGWTHVQGNTNEYWPLQLGQVHSVLFIVEICCLILLISRFVVVLKQCCFLEKFQHTCIRPCIYNSTNCINQLSKWMWGDWRTIYVGRSLALHTFWLCSLTKHELHNQCFSWSIVGVHITNVRILSCIVLGQPQNRNKHMQHRNLPGFMTISLITTVCA